MSELTIEKGFETCPKMFDVTIHVPNLFHVRLNVGQENWVFLRFVRVLVAHGPATRDASCLKHRDLEGNTRGKAHTLEVQRRKCGWDAF